MAADREMRGGLVLFFLLSFFFLCLPGASSVIETGLALLRAGQDRPHCRAAGASPGSDERGCTAVVWSAPQPLGVGCWMAPIQPLSAPCVLVSLKAEPGRPEGWLFLAAVATEQWRLKHWEECGTSSRLGRCCACLQLCDHGRGTQHAMALP